MADQRITDLNHNASPTSDALIEIVSDPEGTPVSESTSIGELPLATAAQGALAETAVQPGDLAAVATSGDYDDLTNKPTLGTAAAADTGDFATAAQGSAADTAVQPGDLGAVATSNDYDDLDNLPTLGTMAAEAAADYVPKAQTVTVESGSTYTLDANDIGVQLILTDSSPELTVPDDEDVAWPIGCWVEVFGPNGPITIVEDTSVTVVPRVSQSLVTEEAGSGFMLKKYAAQTWMCVGAMAAV